MGKGIYKITNKLNNKVYVGQSIHIERRWGEHIRGGSISLIGEAIEKYGVDNFTFERVLDLEGETLNEQETYCINKENSVYPNGYNVVTVVNGRYTGHTKYSEEDLEEMYTMLETSTLTITELAELYSMDKRSMYRINNGEVQRKDDRDYPVRKLDGSRLTHPKEQRKKVLIGNCIDCGTLIGKNSQRCSDCDSVRQRVVERPNKGLFIRQLMMFSFEELGRAYGVSGNSIKKWCINYGIPHEASFYSKFR